MQEYCTIAAPAFAELTEKRSRFLAALAPVETQAQAQAFLAEIRKKHHEARHHCFAYLTREGNITRCSDDGEPSGTGGQPILNVLEGAGLTDVCCVVTRYFGGTLLGTGGLTRAYGGAAAAAAAQAETVRMVQCVLCRVHMDYSFYGKFCKLCERFPMLQGSGEFSDEVAVMAAVRADRFPDFAAAVTELTAGSAEVVEQGKAFRRLPENGEA